MCWPSTRPRRRSCSRASPSTGRSAPSGSHTRPRAAGSRTRPSRRVTTPPSSWWWPGRALSDDDDAEIAIMMVEAGGSERSFQYYDEGAPRVTEEVLAEGLEAAKTWIRESIVLQRKLVAAYIAARGPIEPIEYSTLADYGDDVWARVEAIGTGPLARSQHHRGQGRAQRRPRRRHRVDPDFPGRRVRRSGDRDQGGGPGPHQEAGPQAHRRGGHPDRRADHERDPPAVGRGRPVPDGPWLGPVPAG